MEPLTNTLECPIDMECTFQKIDLLPLKESENGNLNGKTFYAYNIPGVQYYLSIFPNGNTAENRGQTWIFLNANGSEERKITANFIISIKSANFESRNFNYTFQSSRGWGGWCARTDQFFESSQRFFVNGELTIEIKGSLKVARPAVTKISCPISVEWKIKESDLKRKLAKEETSGYFRSKRYLIASFSDVKYYLMLYPNGDTEARKGQTWLFLSIEIGNEKKIEAIFDFSIKSVNYSCNLQYTFESSTSWGSTCCSTDALKTLLSSTDPIQNFLVDEYLIINLNGILMVEKNQNTNLRLSMGLAPATPADQKKKDKEFTIVIGRKKVMVHKKVLSDASPVFAAMLESEMKEALENKMEIPDFSAEIVDAAIKLCYSSSVPRKFSFDDLFLLYKFADKYQIKSIMDLIEEHLLEKLCATNVCQFIEFSKAMNVTKLYASCVRFLMMCSKNGVPVYGANVLDKNLLAEMFLNTLHAVDETALEK